MVQANNFTFNYDTEHLGLNSRQNTVLLVIVILCILICIGLYFLSVSNDYHELQSFYYSFLERKSLICEGRMAHRQDLERMASKLAAETDHQLDNNNVRSELPGLVMEPESDEFMMRPLRPGLDAAQCELGLVEDQPLEWARLDYHAELGTLPDNFSEFLIQWGLGMNLGTLDFKNRIGKEDNLCTNSFEYGKDGKENSFSWLLLKVLKEKWPRPRKRLKRN